MSSIVALLKELSTPDEWRRLQYLARRIKSRTATAREVAEYQLVIAIAKEVTE